MARGVGPKPSDAAAPTAPLPQEGVAQASCGSGEPVPEEPPQRPNRSRWNEWLLTPEVADQFMFEDGERIFEFSDRYSRTGWKPYDQLTQGQLSRIFTDMIGGSSGLLGEPINCLGWVYSVKFDLFHQDRDAFLNAPRDAIGYQVADHEIIRGTKRWIRLTTYPGA